MFLHYFCLPPTVHACFDILHLQFRSPNPSIIPWLHGCIVKFLLQSIPRRKSNADILTPIYSHVDFVVVVWRTSNDIEPQDMGLEKAKTRQDQLYTAFQMYQPGLFAQQSPPKRLNLILCGSSQASNKVGSYRSQLVKRLPELTSDDLPCSTVVFVANGVDGYTTNRDLFDEIASTPGLNRHISSLALVVWQHHDIPEVRQIFSDVPEGIVRWCWFPFSTLRSVGNEADPDTDNVDTRASGLMELWRQISDGKQAWAGGRLSKADCIERMQEILFQKRNSFPLFRHVCSRCKSLKSSRWYEHGSNRSGTTYLCNHCYDFDKAKKCNRCGSTTTSGSWWFRDKRDLSGSFYICKKCYKRQQREDTPPAADSGSPIRVAMPVSRKCNRCPSTTSNGNWYKDKSDLSGSSWLCKNCYMKQPREPKPKAQKAKKCNKCASTTSSGWYRDHSDLSGSSYLCRPCYERQQREQRKQKKQKKGQSSR